jgi:synaptosomal-associated protein 47
MADLKIAEWKCSYYDISRKKWLSGILQLTKSRIRVLMTPNKKSLPAESSQAAVYLSLALDNITDIRKATSGYVFKCVVVTARDGQHWFSSLPVRDNVFNTLNHFWRNRLMPTPEKRHSFPCNSKRGAELLRLAQDPEQSLLEAGEMLMRQGEELEYLVFEEKPQSPLAAWFSRWRVPKEYLVEDIEFTNAKGVPIVHEFPILFCRGETTKTPEKVPLTPGILRVSKDGISILTEGQVPCHLFKPKEVTAVKIVTPWRIVIADYRSNASEISYIITSSHMVRLICVLEVQYRKRFDIEDVPENVEQTFRMSG